ncbi:MAG: NADH-quinone oxidoreductase subunit NuoN [Deltaproteobacteria bacterium]|nr:NADH-quinone oxidoreductase subunit NuoN [Deltaproteobacteria bacterium]
MPAAWIVIAPHAILALAGGLVFCLGAVWPGRTRSLLWWLSLAAALAAGLAALHGPAQGLYQGLLDVGAYGRFFTGLTALLSLLTLLLARRYATERGFVGDVLYGLILLGALGMILTAGAASWLMLFLGLELLSLCLYVLLAIRRDSGASLEAGLKYFVLGAVAGGLLIFGIALLYAAAGTLKIGAPAPGGWGLLGLGLVLTGLAFKLSLAPLHVWTPDVYQGSPAPLTAFLAAGSKTAAAALLIRLAAGLGGDAAVFALPALWLLAALTMVVTNLSALRENRVKRLLAYSSAAQMGYLVMALTGAASGGLGAAFFFVAVYALMDLGVFGFLAGLAPRASDLGPLSDLAGLGRHRPWLAAFLVLCLFSLAGLPPTGGFVGKWFLFTATLRAGHVGLAVVGALAAAAAFYYYFKLTAVVFLTPAEEGEPAPATAQALHPAEGLALALIAAGLLWLGLFPAWLWDLAQKATAGLVG